MRRSGQTHCSSKLGEAVSKHQSFSGSMDTEEGMIAPTKLMRPFLGTGVIDHCTAVCVQLISCCSWTIEQLERPMLLQ